MASDKKRSCLSQLLEHYKCILQGLEQGLNVDTVYLNLSKAFDKVDKGILCKQIKGREYVESNHLASQLSVRTSATYD